MFTQSGTGVVVSAAFAVLILTVCVSDVRTRRIPNRLVLLIAALGVLFSVVSHPWWPGLTRAIGGMAVGLAIWLPFYLVRMLGAGDVKFFAAASAWLGPALALKAALLAGVFGGLLALLWLSRDGWVLAVARLSTMRNGAVLPRPADAGVAGRVAARRVPYGVAMAVGLAAAAWFPEFLF